MKERIEQKLELEKWQYTSFIYWLKIKKAKILYPERIICSRYFDTYDFKMLHDTNEGIQPRKKVRIRTYGVYEFRNSIKSYNLEIKLTKENKRFKKIEENINWTTYQKNGFFDNDYGMCFPIIDIAYCREYFIVNEIRLTIDKEIIYKSNKNLNNKIIIDKSYVVEIKANKDTDINFLLNNFDFPRTRFSKYERGMNSYLELS